MNQRFIEDIEELSKQQTNITNINIASKFDHLEQTILKLEQKCDTLEKSQTSLTTNCTQLEGSVHSLEEKNTSLKDSYFNLEGDYSNLQQKFNKLEESSSLLQEQVIHLEKNEKMLKEEIEKLKEGNKDSKDKFIELNAFRDQQTKTNLTFEEQISSQRVVSQSLEEKISVCKEEIFQFESKVEKLESSSITLASQIKDSNLNKRLDDLEHFDRNIVDKLNKMETDIEKNCEIIAANTLGVDTNRQEIEKMIALQNTTQSAMNQMSEKSSETWNTMTSFISKHNETIQGINEMINVNQDNFTTIEKKLKELDNTNEQFYKSLKEQNADTIKNFDELVGKQNEMNQTLMTNVKNSLDVSNNQIQTNLGIIRDENLHNVQQVNEQMKYTNEKLFKLEEAHQNQLQKNQYFENLNNRINTLDEMRQQSEARARDEVDATISQNNKIVDDLTNNINAKFEKIEMMVKQEQNIVSKYSDSVNAELNGLKNDAAQMGRKLEEVQDANRKVYCDLDQSLNSKLMKYEEIHSSDLERIESQIQESTFIHAEKVSQFENFEAKLKSFEDNLQKVDESNKKKLNDIIEKNKALEDEIKKGGESLVEVQKSVDNSVASYKNQLDVKLKDIEDETKKNSQSLVEIEPVAKSIDGRLEGIKQQIIIENNKHFESFKSEVSTSMEKVTEKNNTVEKHFETIKDNSEKIKAELKEMLMEDQKENMNKIQNMKNETDQALKSSDVLISTMVEKIQNLELSDKDVKTKMTELVKKIDDSDQKLTNLESADLFLQEAHRMLTEKSTKLESDLKQVEATSTKTSEVQKDELKKLLDTNMDLVRGESEGVKNSMNKLYEKLPGRELIFFHFIKTFSNFRT